jgi:hypothetical protein
MDANGIPLGVDFVRRLRAEVSNCGTPLAVIGPGWPDATDQEGRRRLDDPNDFARVEIAEALERDVLVVPILLDGTSIARSDQLPSDLKSLAYRRGLHVRHASFHSDALCGVG